MDQPNREALTRSILEAQKNMFEALRDHSDPDWMSLDLTMPQFKILFLLFNRGAMRMSHLARVLGKNISTATGVVDRLVEEELIKREEDPEDRRVVLVTLTEKSRGLLESFIQRESHRTRGLLSRLNLGELDLVLKSMQIMAKAAREQIEEQIPEKNN